MTGVFTCACGRSYRMQETTPAYRKGQGQHTTGDIQHGARAYDQFAQYDGEGRMVALPDGTELRVLRTLAGDKLRAPLDTGEQVIITLGRYGGYSSARFGKGGIVGEWHNNAASVADALSAAAGVSDGTEQVTDFGAYIAPAGESEDEEQPW